jgi:hypothetical protein
MLAATRHSFIHTNVQPQMIVTASSAIVARRRAAPGVASALTSKRLAGCASRPGFLEHEEREPEAAGLSGQLRLQRAITDALASSSDRTS